MNTANDAWRHELQVGDVIDGLDTVGRWYEARVLALTEETVSIHYLGWSEKWDEEFHRMSRSIAPLYTHASNWRTFCIGDRVEMAKRKQSSNSKKWVLAKVLQVDTPKQLLLIQEEKGAPFTARFWFDLSSENICQLGTHLKIPSDPTNDDIAEAQDEEYVVVEEAHDRMMPMTFEDELDAQDAITCEDYIDVEQVDSWLHSD